MEPFRHARREIVGRMKQKLALSARCCTSRECCFWMNRTNGVDPVSRRDFWAILYQLVRDGLTVFVTTAYLDEAERANRVGIHASRQADPLRYAERAQARSGRSRLSAFKPRIRARRWRCSRPSPECWRLHRPRGSAPFSRCACDLARATRAPDAVRVPADCTGRWRTCSSRCRSRKRRRVLPKGTGPAVHIDQTVKRLGTFRGRSIMCRSTSRRAKSRVPGSQRRRQIDHHPDSVRPAGTHLRKRHGRGFDVRHAARRRQTQYRLHVGRSFLYRRSHVEENIEFFGGCTAFPATTPRPPRLRLKWQVLKIAPP